MTLTEKIVKIGRKWQVQSEKGRNMGTYDTKAEAEERLRQVEYFKHLSESMPEDKVFRLPMHNAAIGRAVNALLEQGYVIEVIPLKKLIYDNVLDQFGALDYHEEDWPGDADSWRIDPEKVKDWRYSDVMTCVRRPGGRLRLDNGHHRVVALRNSGYEGIEMLVWDPTRAETLDEVAENPFGMEWR